jgi:iron complex transport system substrate-binding protein
MSSTRGPQRIACLQPSATVILDALGALHRVVGCTRYCADVVPGVAAGSRAILADSWTADTSQILAVQPDLVIASVPYQEKAVTEILKAGTRFLGLAPRTLADIYTDIGIIGGIVEENGLAEELIQGMQRQIDEVRARLVDVRPVRVFCEEWGKPIIASQKWVAELVEAAGGIFVGEPGRPLSAEQILRENPDVLVASWCGAGDRVPLEKITASRSWQQMTAVVSGRVFCVRDEFLNTPAPTLLQGLDALAWAIHPEVFPRTKGIRRITDVPASIA